MGHLNTRRHDRRRTDEGRVHVVLGGRATSGTTRVVTKLIDAWDGEFVVIFLVGEHGRLGHAGIAESVKDINIARVLRCILEHGVRKSREDVVNLVEE